MGANFVGFQTRTQDLDGMKAEFRNHQDSET